MIIGQMQSYFLPYIGYWQLINAVDTFVLFDNIQFRKKGWIHRNNILLNSEKKLFSLPLKRDSYKLNISDRYLSNDSSDIAQIIAQIKFGYKKAPYFSQVFPIIQDIFLYDEKNLFTYILYSIKKINEYLNINTKIIISSDLNIDNNLKSQDIVIAVNKKLNSSIYINPIGGTELYSKKTMQENGIKLFFLESNIMEYKQFKNKFISHLSIIDIMMFNSKDEIKNMLGEYKLI